MDYPEITVVMPLYNKARQVLGSLSSVCQQSFRNWELVVVDDGSTDESVRIVQSVDDMRIRLIRQSNAGVSAARNLGVRCAKSSLIAFLDADDTWHPDFLESIIALRDDFPRAKVFATSYRYAYRNGISFRPRLNVTSDFKRGILHPYFQIAAASDPPIWSSAVAVDYSALIQVGGFPEGISSGEDLLTWARLAANVSIAYDVRSLATYEVSEIVRSADPYNRVGIELEALLKSGGNIIGLRNYIGYWYYIQSGLALASGQRALAIFRSMRSIIFSPSSYRSWYCFIRSALPLVLIRQLERLHRIQRLKDRH